MVVNLKHEHEKMVDLCQQEEKQIDRLKAVMAMVEKCESRMTPGSDNPLSLEDSASMFKTIQETYYNEYKIYDLATIALAIVFPLVSLVELSLFDTYICDFGLMHNKLKVQWLHTIFFR